MTDERAHYSASFAVVVHGRNESVPAYDGDLVIQVSDLYHDLSAALLVYYFIVSVRPCTRVMRLRIWAAGRHRRHARKRTRTRWWDNQRRRPIRLAHLVVLQLHPRTVSLPFPALQPHRRSDTLAAQRQDVPAAHHQPGHLRSARVLGRRPHAHRDRGRRDARRARGGLERLRRGRAALLRAPQDEPDRRCLLDARRARHDSVYRASEVPSLRAVARKADCNLRG